MSHVAQCQVVIKSLFDLDAAAVRLGGRLVRGQNTIRWYNAGFVDDSTTWKAFFTQAEADRIACLPRAERVSIINAEMSRADHAIVFPHTQYDVGVMAMPDGTYRLRWDQYSRGGGLEKYIGPSGDKFSQAYAIEAAKRAARRKGFSVSEVAHPNGHVKLKLLMQ
jgi:hypothetical protein